MHHCILVKNMMHICRLKGRERERESESTRARGEREFLIIGSNSFDMCVPFTAVEFLNKLVHAFGIYKSPLSFAWVVLVEML